MKIGIELADEGMFQFGVYLYLPLELLVEGRRIDILFGDDLDGHLLIAVLFDSSVNYAKSARAYLFFYDEAVYGEGRGTA